LSVFYDWKVWHGGSEKEIDLWKKELERPAGPLDEIGRRYNCDKGNVQYMSHHWKNVPSGWPQDLDLAITGHNYLEEYEKYFSEVRHKPIKILEIGIGNYPTNARSLMMWLDYFSCAEIHLVDINDRNFVVPDQVDLSRVHFHLLDQSNEAQLTEFAAIHKEKFDFIIDDGSHVGWHQILTLRCLFDSCLKQGGVYFIEDIHDRNFCDAAHELVASVNAGNNLETFSYGEASLKTVSSVKFLRSLVVLEKGEKRTR
jgi:hypothetical protein